MRISQMKFSHDIRASQEGLVKNPPANAGDSRYVGLITGSGRYPGLVSDNPLQYSCMKNSMDRGTWQATNHGATKSQKQLSNSAHTLGQNEEQS